MNLKYIQLMINLIITYVIKFIPPTAEQQQRKSMLTRQRVAKQLTQHIAIKDLSSSRSRTGRIYRSRDRTRSHMIMEESGEVSATLRRMMES